MKIQTGTGLELSETNTPEQSASYEAGTTPTTGTPSIDLDCWRPRAQSADADILPSRQSIDGRVIDLSQNDGYISGAIDLISANMIGNGMRLSLHIDYDALGQSEDWGAKTGDEVEASFRRWAWSSHNRVDVTRRSNWLSIQYQAARSLLIHGEFFAVLESHYRASGGYNLAIRIIDPERVSTPQVMSDTNIRNKDIRNGIEYDSAGRVQAYWISNRHPRAFISPLARYPRLTWQRVAAFKKTFGGRRRQVIFHGYDKIRPEQSRGVSIFTPAIKSMKMLDQFSDAQLRQAMIQTLYGIIVKSDADFDKIMNVVGAEKNEISGLDALQQFITQRGKYYNNMSIKTGDGSQRITHLLPGEDLEFKSNSATSGKDISSFMDTMRQESARSTGLSLESFTGDFSKTNYSSNRMANILTNRVTAVRRDVTIVPFCQWLFDVWFEEHLVRGNTTLPSGVDFYKDRDALTRSEWHGPVMPDADPQKSATAAKLRIEAGLTTMTYEAKQIGLDYDDMMEERARELRTKERLGLFELESKNMASKEAPPPPVAPSAPAPKGKKNGN